MSRTRSRRVRSRNRTGGPLAANPFALLTETGVGTPLLTETGVELEIEHG